MLCENFVRKFCVKFCVKMLDLDLYIPKIGFFKGTNLDLFISKIGFFKMNRGYPGVRSQDCLQVPPCGDSGHHGAGEADGEDL